MSDFNFGNANKAQRQAISTSDGPVLIIAGPGTGKTYTLVQRTIYLIKERNVKPENILIATFTEKAAKELITRITNDFKDYGISANINDMYIGTFHSICLRILKDHIEHTRLRKNYRLMDAFDQQYMVFSNIGQFRAIANLEKLLGKARTWEMARKICAYANNLLEELVTHEQLIDDPDPSIKAIGEMLKTYKGLLEEENLLDFSSIQVEAYKLLREHPEILNEIQSKITHIMVDEYQDTNYIQEQLIFLLAGGKKNICVVGDDDQGLYRFRGATIRNILEFPNKFKKGECRVIPLVVNYRSNSDIIEFYNDWMSSTEDFQWDNFRYNKRIEAHEQSLIKSPAVVRLASKDEDENEWHEKILRFIKELKDSGKLTDYNQIAFLFQSVKNDKVIALADFLEANGINVYSPRSAMFFQREEIKLILGLLISIFPNYVQKLENDEFEFLRSQNGKPNEVREYYMECVKAAKDCLSCPDNSKLNDWILKKRSIHTKLEGTTDYSYSGLVYQIFEFQPFRDILDTDMKAGIIDIRPARNLAKLTQIIGKFEYLRDIDVLNSEYIDSTTEVLFNLYLRLLFIGGIAEYEDDSEYAPSGCVSFLTIHQSKGMEFPIVFVDSLGKPPRDHNDNIMRQIETHYFKRPAFEPYDRIKYFDFWRLYYTAFSRAQNLLILTCAEQKGKQGKGTTPSRYFKYVYEKLTDVENSNFNLSEFNFKTVKKVNLKDTYSFTSHIMVYETCSLQYKFYKELDFTPVRASAMLFGMLVHETIEDIHRAALRHEEHTITEENIKSWFESNYDSLSKAEHSYLAEKQKDSALKQIQRYVDRQNGDWSAIQQAEVDVSLVKPDYIIEGKIDLIRGEGDTVEIVDFKSEPKPKEGEKEDEIARYKKQLNIYAHLVEENTGRKVSKMHLYYTGDTGKRGRKPNPMVSYDCSPAEVEAAIAEFDKTVSKIMSKDFQGRASCKNDRNAQRVCENCDFRHYCKVK